MRLLTVAETAQILQLSTKQIYRLIRQDALPAVRSVRDPYGLTPVTSRSS